MTRLIVLSPLTQERLRRYVVAAGNKWRVDSVPREDGRLNVPVEDLVYDALQAKKQAPTDTEEDVILRLLAERAP